MPDSDAIVREWSERSRRAPDVVDARLGLRCRPTSEEYVDVFPAGEGAPVHLFIDGGYRRRFSARDFAFLAPNFVEAGITLVNLDHDLFPFPYTWLQPVLQLDWKTVLDCSPIMYIPGRAPYLLVAVGGGESSEFRRQSRDHFAACRAKGLPGHLLEVPERDHVRVPEELERPDSELFEALAAASPPCPHSPDRRRCRAPCRFVGR